MRLSLVWFMLLSGCLNLEIEGKPCRTDEGCPLPFNCVAGYCARNSDASTPVNYHYNPDIQDDLKSLTCAQSGCHNASATNKLKIDVNPGREQQNYGSIITNQLIVFGRPDDSPLVVVPRTGTGPTASHVKTLTGNKRILWETWILAGAPF